MSKERPVKREVNPEHLEGFISTFIPRFDMYPFQTTKGAYVSIKKQLSTHQVRGHLLGETATLGAYALDENSKAKWVCFDADDEQEWNSLVSMAGWLTEQRVTPFLEPSRRGGHLWLFTPKLDGYLARNFAQSLAHKFDVNTVEIFPKQDQLQEGPGSLVRLPLGIHQKAGKRYHFVDIDGDPLAPTIRGQIEILSSPPLVPIVFIQETIKEVELSLIDEQPTLREPTKISVRKSKVTGDIPLSDRIKGAISVLEFVSHYVDLDSGDKGLCPFHDDHHRSFQVNDARNYWNCYAGCGGGSIIDFYARWKQLGSDRSDWNTTLHELALLLQVE